MHLNSIMKRNPHPHKVTVKPQIEVGSVLKNSNLMSGPNIAMPMKLKRCYCVTYNCYCTKAAVVIRTCTWTL